LYLVPNFSEIKQSAVELSKLGESWIGQSHCHHSTSYSEQFSFSSPFLTLFSDYFMYYVVTPYKPCDTTSY